MSEFDEEVYSTIFNALRHGVRRNILRMLEGGELTFTAIAERLDISSSHLTYHLDSLKELVSKSDNGYRLSVFGMAAVDTIRRVEEPPNPQVLSERSQKHILVGLLAGFIIIAGLFAVTYFDAKELRSLNRQQEALLDALYDQYESSDSLLGLMDDRPFTRFSQGIYAVSGWTLSYQHDTSKQIPWEDNYYPPYFYSVIYSPVDNLKLQLQPGKYFPMNGFSYPLTIQRGNAWFNESAVKIIRTYKELNITEVTWQSSIIWQMNITDSTAMEVILPSKGWYTICMTGPISKSSGGSTSMKIGISSIVNGARTLVERADVWVDFRLLRGDEKVLFGVWDRG
jgi:DNA-binding transcriptional ArsR family regulator